MKLTTRQTEVAVAIRDYRHRHGVSPTQQEIADQLGVSKIVAHEHVQELIRKGVLTCVKHAARSLAVVDESQLPPMVRCLRLPVMGELSRDGVVMNGGAA